MSFLISDAQAETSPNGVPVTPGAAHAVPAAQAAPTATLVVPDSSVTTAQGSGVPQGVMVAPGGTAPAAVPPGAGMMQVAMIAIFALLFYFMIWRPQSKRQKEHRSMVDAIAKGDEVVTTGGLVGRIVKISDDFLSLNVAEGVDVRVQKQSIAAVLPKGTLKGL